MIKDSPANPYPEKQIVNGTVVTQQNEGLTKYEHFLGLALQGIIASQPRTGYLTPRKAASMAVEYVDELFNEVNHWPEKGN